jgi:ribokinase
MPTKPSVVVVGSINVDMVVSAQALPGPGATVTGGTFEQHGGGKGANQAVAASRLGAVTLLIAAVGDDAAGDDAMRALADEGVDVSHVACLDGVATGVALIVVGERGENQIAVASGANERLTGEMVVSALQDVELVAQGVCVVGFEVGDAAVEAAADWASAQGHRVVLNPAPARAVSSTMAVTRPILTPNRGEAQMLSGEDKLTDAGNALHRLTGSPVLITMGGEGVLIVDQVSSRRSVAYEVEAVDTTGAGDAFNGALAVGLSEGLSLPDAVDLGQAAAALSTLAEGARTGMPSREAVGEFMTARQRS